MDIESEELPREAESHRRRRPATIQRTGRRGKLNALVAESRTLAGSSSDFSTRHTRVRQETGGNPVTILNRLLNTLQESGIPGPQLFRLDKEFSRQLGQGGQGNVRGIDLEVAQQYRRVHQQVQRSWPVDRVAIKQHMESKDGRAHKTHFDRDNLTSRFRAAECEVLALAPGLFQDHPNIVKLIGWGLCLDTAEDPTSPCCGGLQLPLLVFERAEMNYAQFLENTFSTTRNERSDEARLEEGLTLRGQMKQSSSLCGRLWRSIRTWASTEHDTYELVQLLCLDIGHGLESLHDNNFTHGDLKPDNVLVFRVAGGWQAKLCDFGCSVGRDNDAPPTSSNVDDNTDTGPTQKSKRLRATYLGTPGWLPSNHEINAIRDFDELRRCDLYVYGLLVWSSFCLEGRPYSRRPRLQDMLDDVTELTKPGRRRQPSSLVCQEWIALQVMQVLRDTMQEPEQRSLTPWILLYRHGIDKRGQDHARKAPQKDKRPTKILFQGSNSNDVYLSLEAKARYNTLELWSRRDPQGHDQILTPTSDQYGSGPGENNDDYIPGPASSVALTADYNCLSTALFRTQTRLEDSGHLHSRMISIVHTLNRILDNCDSMSRSPMPWREQLYYLARFRSRVPIAWWWRPLGTRQKNILQEVLRLVPSIDIHTLAWLCAGPVGRDEVRSLDFHPWTWECILEPDVLDESERLDRFLLLLQFGALIHKEPPLGAMDEDLDLSEMPKQKGYDIIEKFMGSFSPQHIVDVVWSQIFRRLTEARENGLISHSNFMVLVQDINTGYISLSKEGIKARKQAETSSAAMETSPSIHPTSLPHGWSTITNTLTKNALACYEDGFTHSVTLTRPKVSPLQKRQLTVGFLLEHGKDDLTCHVDLLSCMRFRPGKKDPSELAHDLEKRFPYYNDAWFAAEWNTEPNVIDVIGTLKAQLEILTFTSLLNIRGNGNWRAFGTIMAFLTGFFFFFFSVAAVVNGLHSKGP